MNILDSPLFLWLLMHHQHQWDSDYMLALLRVIASLHFSHLLGDLWNPENRSRWNQALCSKSTACNANTWAIKLAFKNIRSSSLLRRSSDQNRLDMQPKRASTSKASCIKQPIGNCFSKSSHHRCTWSLVARKTYFMGKTLF